MPPAPATEAAPAKVNLCLHVIGRRADGYHMLDSLVVFAGAGDRVTAAPGQGLSLTLDGPEAAGLAAEPDNLVLRAARAVESSVSFTPSISRATWSVWTSVGASCGTGLDRGFMATLLWK